MNKSQFFSNIPFSSTNFCLVKPEPVIIDDFLLSERVGCTRRVHWQPLDTGKCSVEYNIQFRNRHGTVLGNATNIRNNVSFYCTDDYASSYSVTMWASHKGIKGTESKVTILFVRRKITIAEAKGMQVFLI